MAVRRGRLPEPAQLDERLHGARVCDLLSELSVHQDRSSRQHHHSGRSLSCYFRAGRSRRMRTERRERHSKPSVMPYLRQQRLSVGFVSKRRVTSMGVTGPSHGSGFGKRLSRPLALIAACSAILGGAAAAQLWGAGQDAHDVLGAEYAVLSDAPEPADLAELRWARESTAFQPATVRLSFEDGLGRYIAGQSPGGGICIRLETKLGGAYQFCSPSAADLAGSKGALWLLAGGQYVDHKNVLFGLVPDGFSTITVDGRVASVTRNMFRVDLAGRDISRVVLSGPGRSEAIEANLREAAVSPAD